MRFHRLSALCKPSIRRFSFRWSFIGAGIIICAVRKSDSETGSFRARFHITSKQADGHNKIQAKEPKVSVESNFSRCHRSEFEPAGANTASQCQPDAAGDCRRVPE